VTLLQASGLTSTVSNGPLLAAAAVAALVGVIGFASPCVLPLVPGYLAYVAGLSGADDRPSIRRNVAGALLFVLGFSAIFVSSGILFGSLGSYIQQYVVTLERIFGAVTIVFGLAFLGWIPFLQRERKIHRLPKAGLVGAPLLGLTFGLAWTPCLTPTLSVVFNLAQSQASAGRGAFLSVFYCLGLGIPFVLVALGIGWMGRTVAFLRRHARAVSQVGGAFLIVFGLLLLSGEWNHWMNLLRTWAGGNGSGIQV
jgi:cytochrome c-type biogenesis protein